MRIIIVESKSCAFNKPFFLFFVFFLSQGEGQSRKFAPGSWSISEKEEKAEEEEYDNVAGHCKLNYLNVRTVIMAKGMKIKR